MTIRKIKFRGLSYDKKTWYYGIPSYLIEENYDDGIIDGIQTDFDTNEDVIPETVGMFTGKVDVNGQEIYEGDWVQSGYTAKIVWDEYLGAFLSIYSHPDDPEELLLSDLGDNIRVVGNIHQV